MPTFREHCSSSGREAIWYLVYINCEGTVFGYNFDQLSNSRGNSNPKKKKWRHRRIRQLVIVLRPISWFQHVWSIIARLQAWKSTVVAIIITRPVANSPRRIFCDSAFFSAFDRVHASPGQADFVWYRRWILANSVDGLARDASLESTCPRGYTDR